MSDRCGAYGGVFKYMGHSGEFVCMLKKGHKDEYHCAAPYGQVTRWSGNFVQAEIGHASSSPSGRPSVYNFTSRSDFMSASKAWEQALAEWKLSVAEVDDRLSERIASRHPGYAPTSVAVKKPKKRPKRSWWTRFLDWASDKLYGPL